MNRKTLQRKGKKQRIEESRYKIAVNVENITAVTKLKIAKDSDKEKRQQKSFTPKMCFTIGSVFTLKHMVQLLLSVSFDWNRLFIFVGIGLFFCSIGCIRVCSQCCRRFLVHSLKR